MRLSVVLTVFVTTALVLSTPASAGLIGSTVTGTLYYPDLNTIYAGPASTAVADPSIEFTFTTGTLDITDTQIIWTATGSATYGAGPFNGFDLQFSGAPIITGVTQNGSTTLIPVGFSSNGNSVQLNLAGLTAFSGQKTILDIETATAAVPEPGSLVLFGTGLLILVGRKRKLFGRAD